MGEVATSLFSVRRFVIEMNLASSVMNSTLSGSRWGLGSIYASRLKDSSLSLGGGVGYEYLDLEADNTDNTPYNSHAFYLQGQLAVGAYGQGGYQPERFWIALLLGGRKLAVASAEGDSGPQLVGMIALKIGSRYYIPLAEGVSVCLGGEMIGGTYSKSSALYLGMGGTIGMTFY